MIGEMTHPDRGFTLKADLVETEPKVNFGLAFDKFREGDHVIYYPTIPRLWAKDRLRTYRIGRIRSINRDSVLIENIGSDQDEVHYLGMVEMSLLYREMLENTWNNAPDLLQP